jgi:hypothetical protein
MEEYLAVVTYREKAKMFRFEGWDRPEQPDGREILRDPKLMADMLAKVLELKRDQLLELQHIRRNQENLASNANGGEPAYRYVASAFKELRRAIDFYERLRTMKL